MEPSIPFHTFFNLIDSEDIVNVRIRTNDLALEIVADKLDSNKLEDEEHQIILINKNPRKN